VTYVAEPLGGAPSRAFLLTLAAPGLALSLAITVVSVYAPPVIAALSSPGVAGRHHRCGGRLRAAGPGGRRLALGPHPLAAGKPDAVHGRRRAAARRGAARPARDDQPGGRRGRAVRLLSRLLLRLRPVPGAVSGLRPSRPPGTGARLQSTLREVGLGLALVGGGLLFATGRALPFLVAAAITAVVMAVFVTTVRDPALGPRRSSARSTR
jgi:hypothetical protein